MDSETGSFIYSLFREVDFAIASIDAIIESYSTSADESMTSEREPGALSVGISQAVLRFNNRKIEQGIVI